MGRARRTTERHAGAQLALVTLALAVPAPLAAQDAETSAPDFAPVSAGVAPPTAAVAFQLTAGSEDERPVVHVDRGGGWSELCQLPCTTRLDLGELTLGLAPEAAPDLPERAAGLVVLESDATITFERVDRSGRRDAGALLIVLGTALLAGSAAFWVAAVEYVPGPGWDFTAAGFGLGGIVTAIGGTVSLGLGIALAAGNDFVVARLETALPTAP